MMKVLYTVDAPYSTDFIEVYGDSDNACYEWRILSAARDVVFDSASEGAGRQYGNASIALLDALIYASDDETP